MVEIINKSLAWITSIDWKFVIITTGFLSIYFLVLLSAVGVISWKTDIVISTTTVVVIALVALIGYNIIKNNEESG